jgi:hypothetical protein
MLSKNKNAEELLSNERGRDNSRKNNNKNKMNKEFTR